jgi:hypothetical protein
VVGWTRATKQNMILLITPATRGRECAQALHATTTLPTHVASTLQAAVSKLREQEYSAVVIDQCLMEAEPDEGEQMLQHLGSASPVYVNCAISGVERVVREVRSALSRRLREEEIARVSAARAIWSELKESVTAILLSCDLVLASNEVPPAMTNKIQVIHDLAMRMRGKLSPAEQSTPTT